MPVTSYAKRKEMVARREKEVSRIGRDIGPIRPIADIKRRESCRDDPELFCRIYNPTPFYLPFCRDHLDMIARIKEAATMGALYAFAMDRGKGKSTVCRMMTLWAVSYALRRYAFLIGANDSKGKDNLQAIKTYIRFLPIYAADFPEIAQPAQSLAGIAQKAHGQLCNGEPTLIEWSNERIFLPTVPPPENWPESWPLRNDGMVPTSGSVIGASGLTAEGIRGSLITLSTGESLRPDLVLLDDPQSRESASSPSQNAMRIELISGDILGMAGPGKTISAVMPCTIIKRGDMADEILDRKKHPLWRGEKRKILISMPTNMKAWEPYFEIYAECAQMEPPNYDKANGYYLQHRAEMDAGAEASWPERKLAHEISAIQFAMNLYYRDPAAFMAEYQNEPMLDEVTGAEEITADAIAAKITRRPLGQVPLTCSRLTAFVDVQKRILYYVVAAWDDDFTGYIIDYGTFPEQKRDYFAYSDVRRTLQSIDSKSGLEGQVYGGLEKLTTQILGKAWRREDDVALKIERCLVDANWGESRDVIYHFCRQSAFSGVLMPSHGKFFGASSIPISEQGKKPGDRVGLNWKMPVNKGKGLVRYVVYDTNFWKSFVHARLSVSMGGRGCLSLFGDKPAQHKMFADHLTAEYRVRTEGRGRVVDEWKMRPDRTDNHWLDCTVGVAIAASIQGVSLEAVHQPNKPKVKRPPVSWAAIAAAARGRR